MARSTGTKAVAERMVRAEDDFVEILMNMGAIDREEAERVFQYYRKHRITRMDAVIGRVSVIDGQFLDRNVIQRVVAL